MATHFPYYDGEDLPLKGVLFHNRKNKEEIRIQNMDVVGPYFGSSILDEINPQTLLELKEEEMNIPCVQYRTQKDGNKKHHHDPCMNERLLSGDIETHIIVEEAEHSESCGFNVCQIHEEKGVSLRTFYVSKDKTDQFVDEADIPEIKKTHGVKAKCSCRFDSHQLKKKDQVLSKTFFVEKNGEIKKKTVFVPRLYVGAGKERFPKKIKEHEVIRAARKCSCVEQGIARA